MSRRPVNPPYTITTEFGVADSYAKFGRHSGVDYAVPLNRPIYAPASGQLTNIKSATGGNMVQIFDGKHYHRLMHNNSFSRGNGAVREGDEVAKAGTTGLSTGVHCHWDIATVANPTSFNQFISPAVWLAQPALPQGGEQMIIRNAENWFSRCNKTMMQMRGRSLGREEFNKYAVGSEFLHWVEAVSDNAEANNWYENGKVGAVARRDNWQGQIYGLIDQNKVLQKQIADLKDGGSVDQETIDKLTKQADDLEKSIAGLKKK